MNINDGSETAESSSGEVDLLMEISAILNTGLDRASLTILLQLLEQGAHPEALAQVVLELDRELRSVRNKEEQEKRRALQLGSDE
ncbi:hypothetical protein ACSSS7_007160 [Eimeria intestinalis]